MSPQQLQGKKFRVRRLEGSLRQRFGDRTDGLVPNDEVTVESISPGHDGMYARVLKQNGKKSTHLIPLCLLHIRKFVRPEDVMQHPTNRIVGPTFVNPISREETSEGFGWKVALADDPSVQFVASKFDIWQD